MVQSFGSLLSFISSNASAKRSPESSSRTSTSSRSERSSARTHTSREHSASNLRDRDSHETPDGVAILDHHSLLDELHRTQQRSESLTHRLKVLFPGVNFDSNEPVVLPTARRVDLWRSPEDWQIVPSESGSRIMRSEMRSLALYASEGRVSELLDFVVAHKRHLSRFSIVTSEDLRPRVARRLGKNALILGAADHVHDAKGGLALLQTRLVLESVGGAVVFDDGADCAQRAAFASTFRMLNVEDVVVATNRASADAMMFVLDRMAVMREPELAPSFFVSTQSAAVPAYKAEQALLIDQLKSSRCAVPPVKTAAVASSPLPALEGSLPRAEQPPEDERLDDGRTSPRSTRASLEYVNFGTLPDTPGTRHIVNFGTLPDSPGNQYVIFGTRSPDAHGAKHIEEHPDAIGKRFSVRNQLRDAPSRRGSSRDQSIASASAIPRKPHMLARDSMRCLALVSHNHMKEEMKKFVEAHKEVLRGYRLTGTASTMKMLSEVLGTTDLGGFSCSSGPLGGDAQIGTYICLEQIGGVLFFTDPLSAHPHQADVEFLHRVIDQHNVLHATNPSSAHVMITLLETALTEGRRDLIPSFFSRRERIDKIVQTMRVAVKTLSWSHGVKRSSLDKRGDLAHTEPALAADRRHQGMLAALRVASLLAAGSAVGALAALAVVTKRR